MAEEDLLGFLEEELASVESETFFYWESEETQDLLEMVVQLISKATAENNRVIGQQLRDAQRRARR